MKLYDHTVPTPSGEELSLKQFEGKVLMIVNTATGCGFTPQYRDIEVMYEKYRSQGFEVLDIPSNEFGGQTPGSDEAIQEFCQLNYQTQFPQMRKSEVNGQDALPLYQHLKKQQGFRGFGKGPKALAMKALMLKTDRNYKDNADIKWNFTKFIVDRTGQVVARFEPNEDMKKVEQFVQGLLQILSSQ